MDYMTLEIDGLTHSFGENVLYKKCRLYTQ